ncbi:multiple epidermal growth factor-like domains protein 10 [Parasteatoda tepidariorum]|uniref:multiple epidermal growth factor-like domains protein 10 n=1 Tax=Parasteatoda tepidariorum TaxID=114398 RepID=UPI0039BD646A
MEVFLILMFLHYYALGSPTCSKTESYLETYTKSYTYPVQITYKTSCMIFFSCDAKRTEYRIRYKVESQVRHRLVNVCCSGYVSNGINCEPVCVNGCGHGKCVSPNVCSCEAGWKGVTCSQSCEGGFYGSGCTNSCACHNDARCSPTTGYCFCKDVKYLIIFFSFPTSYYL